MKSKFDKAAHYGWYTPEMTAAMDEIIRDHRCRQFDGRNFSGNLFILDVTTPFVAATKYTAKSRAYLVAQQLDAKGVFDDFIVLTVEGEGIFQVYKQNGKIKHKMLENSEENLSSVIKNYDEQMEKSVWLCGYNMVGRSVSVKSKKRVLTHVLLLSSEKGSQDDLWQLYGRPFGYTRSLLTEYGIPKYKVLMTETAHVSLHGVKESDGSWFKKPFYLRQLEIMQAAIDNQWKTKEFQFPSDDRDWGFKNMKTFPHFVLRCLNLVEKKGPNLNYFPDQEVEASDEKFLNQEYFAIHGFEHESCFSTDFVMAILDSGVLKERGCPILNELISLRRHTNDYETKAKELEKKINENIKKSGKCGRISGNNCTMLKDLKSLQKVVSPYTKLHHGDTGNKARGQNPGKCGNYSIKNKYQKDKLADYWWLESHSDDDVPDVYGIYRTFESVPEVGQKYIWFKMVCKIIGKKVISRQVYIVETLRRGRK